MPTYEYRCPDGHEFELFQRMSDEPVASCPECGKASTRLLSAGGGLLFKGEGFYITDYRSTEYKQKAKAESPGGSAGSGGAGDGGSGGTGGSGGSADGGASGGSTSTSAKPSPKPSSSD